MTGWLVGWFVGQSVVLVGWLVVCFVCSSVCLFVVVFFCLRSYVDVRMLSFVLTITLYVLIFALVVWLIYI